MIASTELEVRALLRAPCPIVRFNALVAGRHKLRILWELRDGPKRYGAIQRALVDASGGASITPRVLSRELRELCATGLGTRKQFPGVPPRVEYTMSADGRALLDVMHSICRWGETAAKPRLRRSNGTR
ncbi:MAG TPA: helix-turn-helix domain-containing protein [Polyangiaceae bacterium]|nr:helix-turn-helix domain-containing protein [Polyangiaceae bacterium]